MKLVFIYGPPASGKLTIARQISVLVGLPVFHNHLVVDAVASVFSFGTPSFNMLRESFWLAVMREAARERRSLLFTFAPEPTVSEGFPLQAQEAVEEMGGSTAFIRLIVSPIEQERRLGEPSRNEFAKMRSVEQLRRLRDEFAACEAQMPAAELTVDTTDTSPRQAALAIINQLRLATPWQNGQRE